MPLSPAYQLKITLQDIRPQVMRRILVSMDITFWDLHVAIQDVMGWEDRHLFEFRIPRHGQILVLGVPDSMQPDIIPCWEHEIILHILPKNPRCEYVYDFGDDWRHSIELEDLVVLDEPLDEPRCVGGDGASPPEDCGGAHIYQEMERDPSLGFDAEAVEFRDPFQVFKARWP